MQKKVSIIVVNYNGGKLLFQALSALERQTYKNFEVIVVDNNSQDDSLRYISNMSKEIFLIKLDKNHGFAGGNIEGLKYCTGEYIVLLNNDTEATPDWLENLVYGFTYSDSIGICASKLVVYGTNIIDSAGDGCTKTGRGYKIGEGHLVHNFSKDKYVFGACGGAVAYRKSMIDEIGFLDRDFFLIHEDSDLNFRAQLYGWKCLYKSNAIVYHKVRSTIGEMSDLAVFYSVRNADYVLLKNMPISLIVRYLPQIVLNELASIIYFCIKKRKWKIFVLAKLELLKNFRQILSKRKIIQNNKKVTIEYIDGILASIFSRDIFRSKLMKLFGR